MRIIRGDRLPEAIKREVLAAFVYRHLDTMVSSDTGWLMAHAFYVTREGRLSRKHRHCLPAFMAKEK